MKNMGRRIRRVVITDIPSDSEPVDGMCDSENEEEVLVPRIPTEGFSPPLEDVGPDAQISDEEDTEPASGGQVWTSVARPRTDIPFSKDYGPNIPDSVDSPSKIFLHLFPEHLLDHIVQQTNLYATQKKS